MNTVQILGWVAVALTALVTAPYWLRKLNGWTFKTRDKRFLNFIKFLRKLHKPAGILLVALTLWHGLLALGTLRLHTGLIAHVAFVITGLLGIAFWLIKDKRAFQGHKVMALVSVMLVLVHIFWRGAVYQLFGV